MTVTPLPPATPTPANMKPAMHAPAVAPAVTPLALFLALKGEFARVGFKSNPKPAAAFKGVVLEKVTFGVFRAGINYANMATVKAGIAAGERDEVGPLPWGEWVNFPYVITHKGHTYLRLATVKGGKMEVTYKVNGVVVTKDEFNGYLTPSAAAGGGPVDVFTIKAENLLEVNGVEAA
jgi:hypothetical protein